MQKANARALLKQALGPAAEFRDGQWEAIDLAANRRQRVLVVQRTGWGKSIVYFLAAKILRLDGAGPTLVISPLLALMRNQILAAEKLGIRAVTLHSENVEEWSGVEQALRSDGVDLLLISPERLGSAIFAKKLLPMIQNGIGMFVVDEQRGDKQSRRRPSEPWPQANPSDAKGCPHPGCCAPPPRPRVKPTRRLRCLL